MLSMTATSRRLALLAALIAVAAAVSAPAPAPGPKRATPAALATRLDAILKRAPAPEEGRFVEALYEGVVELEAHFRKPGEKRPYHSRRRFLSDGRGSVRLDWTTWPQGDSAEATESWLYSGGTLLYRESPARLWGIVAADRRDPMLEQTLAGFPWEVVRDLRSRLAARKGRVSGGGPDGLWNVEDGRSPAASALVLRPDGGAVLSFLTKDRKSTRLNSSH